MACCAFACVKHTWSACSDAEQNRLGEFLAARCIQSCYRGWLARKHFWMLHEAATRIQKVWRGYSGRKLFVSLLIARVEELSRRHFDTMATIIQKTWRGHVVRTRVFDYYLLRSWIRGVLGKNGELAQRMMVFKAEVEDRMKDELEEEAREWVLFVLFKLHHLLRTHSQPGIYSLQGSMELSDLERQLAHVADHMKAVRKKRMSLRKCQGRCLAHWWRSGDCGDSPRLLVEEPRRDDVTGTPPQHSPIKKKTFEDIQDGDLSL
ncbi:spermatogenesis-associated protein 17-like isoform X2 [Bacillus rossius redtenbacheri]|uniref:spermatogenesis-associated protein 17-like isoform X2 n=1 Tax=Bacillus rossius redtenbacheri TaxID=93214 RepID=UPI002FDEEED9